MCRDENAALDILQRGLAVVGGEWNRTVEHTETESAMAQTSGDMNTSEWSGQPVDLSVVVEPERAVREAV